MKKLDERLPDAARSGATGGEPLDTLFERARGDGFTAAETDALWNRVGVTIGHTGGHASSGASASGPVAAATSGSALKVAAAWVIGGALVMGGAGLTTVGIAGRAARDSVAESAAAISSVGPSAAPPGAVAVDLSEAIPKASTERSLDFARGLGASGASSAAGRPQADRTPRAALPAATAATAGGRTEAPSRSVPAWHPPAGSDESGEPRSAPTESPRVAVEPSQPGAAPTAAGEGALLLRARQILPSDPAAALDLTREHARRFPAGTLVPEREVLAIDALAQLGRLSEARARFSGFRARFPQSPHLARLEALLAR